jgi:hypothetical protein
MRAILRQLPLQAKIAFPSCLRVGRDDRHEQCAFFDLSADLLIPRIASAKLALVEPDLDRSSAKRIADFPRRHRVLRGIAQEDGFRGGAHCELRIAECGLSKLNIPNSKRRVNRVRAARHGRESREA